MLEIIYNEPHLPPHPSVLTPHTDNGALTGLIIHTAFDGVAVVGGGLLKLADVT